MGFASKYRNEIGLLIAIIGVVGFTLIFDQAHANRSHGYSLLNSSYLTAPGLNLKNILHQTALLGIFSLGAAIVIIVGGRSGTLVEFSIAYDEGRLIGVLTGTGGVDRIITNLGVLDVVEGGLKIVETAPDVTEDDIRAATEATIVN